MLRILRPVLFVLAVVLLLLVDRTEASPPASGSLPEMQTPAPTGRVVVKLTVGADQSDRDRLSAMAATAATARIAPDLLLAVADKSRRPAATLSDLARYVQFDRTGASRDELLLLVRRLAADPAVETAFLEPRAVPASLGFDAFTGATPTPSDGEITPLPTDDFTPMQGYLGDAPDGVGARTMWSQPGARGGTVKIVDIEGAWLWDHEDLPAPFLDLGIHIDDLAWRNHGTAVLGEMRGIENGYGVDGIVPDCQVGNSSIGNQSVAGALLNAAVHLDQGDLLLIELHAPGPNANGSGQYGYVPMEFWQDNFDAIRALTEMGLIVVEAAGNGQQDLDLPVYNGLFDRQVRDSGAIMVGATDGGTLDAAWFTNHGQRVDLCGWGLYVTTCAYGDLQSGDEIEWYTQQFSGTSSASPIVTGSVASLQGMIEAANGFPADANLVREILRQTGTATSGPQLIGPRPDLVAAWNLADIGVSMLTGTVTEQGSGLPIAGVAVTLLPSGPTVTTGADGTYRLGLLPGTYMLDFDSYFHDVHTGDVTVTAGTNIHDTSLVLLPLEVIGGTVTANDLSPLAGARLELIDEPVPAAFTDGGGVYAFQPVPEGLIHAMFAGGVPGFGGAYREFPLPVVGLIDVPVTLPDVDYDFEAGAQGFFATNATWQRGRPSDSGMGPGNAFDGQWCWGVGIDGGGYGDEASGHLWSPYYELGDHEGDRLYLSFHYWSGTESGFDGVHVRLDPGSLDEVITPVNGYTDLTLGGVDHQPGWSGHSGGWRTAVFDVTSRLEASIWNFGLVFGSDSAVTDEGFLVDGFCLEAVNLPTAAPDGAVPGAAAPVLAAWPNPFNPRVNLAWELAAPGRIDLVIYDVRGRLVCGLLQDAPVTDRGHVMWDGTDRTGRTVPSGIYLVQIRDESGATSSRHITLAR